MADKAALTILGGIFFVFIGGYFAYDYKHGLKRTIKSYELQIDYLKKKPRLPLVMALIIAIFGIVIIVQGIWALING
jgi:hypothetical protein